MLAKSIYILSKSEKKTALGRDRTRVLLHHILPPYPLRHEDEMKILTKKKGLLNLKWQANLG